MSNESSPGNGTGARSEARALINKLGRFVPLNDDECEALRHLARHARRLRRGTDLISEGDKPVSVFLLLEGWAYRYKSMVDGGRQIMAYLLPGDLCDVQIFLFEEMDIVSACCPTP